MSKKYFFVIDFGPEKTHHLDNRLFYLSFDNALNYLIKSGFVLREEDENTLIDVSI